MKRILFALLVVACKDKSATVPDPTPGTPGSAETTASIPPPPSEMDGPPGKDPNFGSAAVGIGLANLPPSQVLLDDMKVFCAINPADSKAGLGEWTKQMQTKPEVADLWANAIQGDAAAQTRLRAGADAAVGVGKCNAMIDSMFGKKPPQ
jgi:hypothetical protein